MISLSDSQLEIIIREAESMADDSCQDFLGRVAAILQIRGQINDNEVSLAVLQALRGLIHSSDVWKSWKRNLSPMSEDEEPATLDRVQIVKRDFRRTIESYSDF